MRGTSGMNASATFPPWMADGKDSSSFEVKKVVDNSSEESSDDFFESFGAGSSELMLRYSPAVSSLYVIAYTVVFVIGIIGKFTSRV